MGGRLTRTIVIQEINLVSASYLNCLFKENVLIAQRAYDEILSNILLIALQRCKMIII